MSFTSRHNDFDMFDRRRKKGLTTGKKVAIGGVVALVLVAVVYFSISAFSDSSDPAAEYRTADVNYDKRNWGTDKRLKGRNGNKRQTEEDSQPAKNAYEEEKQRQERVDLLNKISVLEARVNDLQNRLLKSEEKVQECRTELDEIKGTDGVSAAEELETVKRAFELCSADISWMMDRSAAFEQLLITNNIDYSNVP